MKKVFCIYVVVMFLMLFGIVVIIPKWQQPVALPVVSTKITEPLVECIPVTTAPFQEIVSEDSQYRVYFTVSDDGYLVEFDPELQDYIYEKCKEYGIDGFESLVVAQLYQESSFKIDLVHYNNNGTSDWGIAQINSCNHERLQKELGITDFMDVKQSIQCGVYIISENLKNNEYNVHKALVAYNMGQSAVNSGITESEYSRRIVELRQNLVREERTYDE